MAELVLTTEASEGGRESLKEDDTTTTIGLTDEDDIMTIDVNIVSGAAGTGEADGAQLKSEEDGPSPCSPPGTNIEDADRQQTSRSAATPESNRKLEVLSAVFCDAVESPTKNVLLSDDVVTVEVQPATPISTRGNTSEENGDSSGSDDDERTWRRNAAREEEDSFYTNPDHAWQSIRRKAAGGLPSNSSSSSFHGDDASRRTEEEAVAVKRLSVLAVKSAARHCRRSFAHYDGASALTNLADSYSISERSFNVNAPCGASATSSSAAEEVGAMLGNELVLAAPQFWNELGGDVPKRCALKENGKVPLAFTPASCTGVVLEVSLNHMNAEELERRRRRFCQLPLWRPSGGHQVENTPKLHFENFDIGALYYRHFFSDSDHLNLFSIDAGLGPIAISLRRETVEINSMSSFHTTDGVGSTRGDTTPSTPPPVIYSPGGVRHHYRVIIRTSRPTALRGTVSEDSIVAAGAQLRPTPNNPGLSVRDVIAFVAPEVHISSLRIGENTPKVVETLLKLDELGLGAQFKFGVVYSKANQSTEEDMYNNETGSDAFYEFMDCLGDKVELKGFPDYRGQLDNKNDSTGEHSYYTRFQGMEVMFHVSTMLPYTPNHRQQLLRKRHIGNDIVTIIFQEEDALPFTPAVIRSQFQHVFIVVRRAPPCPRTGRARYSVAVSQVKDIPPFGPTLPEDPTFVIGSDFRAFMLTKLINAERAGHCSQKFLNMAMRTRSEYLSSLAKEHSSTQGLEGSGGGSLLSRLRKQLSSDKSRQTSLPMATTVDLLHLPGAMVWPVVVTDWGLGREEHHLECLLSISHAGVVLLDPEQHVIRTNIPPDHVAGWVAEGQAIRLFYRGNAYVSFLTNSGPVLSDEAVAEVVVRLSACTKGCSGVEMVLRKENASDYGFLVHHDGVVSEVCDSLPGYAAGVRCGSRIVDMDGVAVYGQPMEEIVAHLREALVIKAIVIPPNTDHTPRGGRHVSTNVVGGDELSGGLHRSLSNRSGQNGDCISPESPGTSARRLSLRKKMNEKWMQEVLGSAGSRSRPRSSSIDSPSLRGVVRKAKDRLAAKSSLSHDAKAPSPVAGHRRSPSATLVPGMSE